MHEPAFLSVTLIAGWGSSRCAPLTVDAGAAAKPAPNTTSALSRESPSNTSARRQAVGQGPAITCALAKIVSPPTAAPTSAITDLRQLRLVGANLERINLEGAVLKGTNRTAESGSKPT